MITKHPPPSPESATHNMKRPLTLFIMYTFISYVTGSDPPSFITTLVDGQRTVAGTECPLLAVYCKLF